MRRVVVTGLGAITPLALNVKDHWDGLLNGRSGIGRITTFDPSEYPTQIAGEVKGFDPTQFMNFKEARRMARCSQLAIGAAKEALGDAGLTDALRAGAEADRVGVVMGSAIGGFDMALQGVEVIREKGWKRVSPFSVPESLANMPAHHVSLHYGAKGFNNSVVTACAAGTQAVGEAMEAIRWGRAEVILAGGAEAMLLPVCIIGFSAMRGLSTRNDQPERASRPFDKNRDGFCVGEGAAILVLEELEHAEARGAKIYAEVLGYGASSDAYDVAAPDPVGEGAVRAMRWAIEDAGLKPEQIDYINAHGSSTPIGDAVETLAIKTLFGERAYAIPISSTKSMVGHSFGATGAIEAISCVMTLRDQIIHPTINYETPDPACDLDYVPNTARPAVVRYTLSNSFGLGGQNACLVMGRYPLDSNLEMASTAHE
ncbi:MAG: beta-ketoacyl-ACP synthase II [Chloroflexi bacterium]|nr:beta-ketoacyl-ACP synthase II [Chloroflexota bacterium]